MAGDARVDVTVVMTTHREGTLAHHTLRALRRSVQHAADAGVSVAVLVVLDSPDDSTREFVLAAAGPEGYFKGLCSSDVIEVAVRDPGLARNAGVRHSSSDYVGVIDGDNLPSGNWLTEGVLVLRAAGPPSVVHPEFLVTFGGRSELWPQWASDDERFTLANMYDRNYWDTVCLAHREVFERFPYTATHADGYGYEDWHWYTRTLEAGVPHRVATDTAYFYRIKGSDSVNESHDARGSVIAPTDLLVNPSLAKQIAHAPVVATNRRLVRTPQTRAVLKARRATGPREPIVAPPSLRERWLGRLLASPVVPAHYRLLHPDVAGLSDAQLRQHHRGSGQAEGRKPRLSDDELQALRPEVFDVGHYRILHADLAAMDDSAVVRHYLDHGRAEQRPTLLGSRALAALAALDVDDYRLDNLDLRGKNPDELVAHFLLLGRHELRRPSLPAGERSNAVPVTLSQTLLDDWRALHELEPLLPIPTPDRVERYTMIGPPADGSITPPSTVWWRGQDALEGMRPQAILFAPWLRMGGADILVARYAQTIAESRPDWDVLVITTHAQSSKQSWMPPNVRLLELPEIEGYSELSARQRRDFAANLVVQLGPELVHIINSPEAYDAFESSSRAMTRASRVHLTTFVIDRDPDGNIFSYLTKRRPGFLDDVESVIVDNQALVDQLVELYCYPRDKFHVHHQATELAPRMSPRPRQEGESLRVLWAARFDRQKRLDVLADVVEAAAAEGIPVEWHVFGAPVIDSPAETEDALQRLGAAGAVLHGSYSSDKPLVLADYDAFILTSESEGIPLTLLDVMAARLPVIAAAVGGVPELIDTETGYPVRDHEDVAAYLTALRLVLDSPEEAWDRAELGYQRLLADFSWEAFRERTQATPGYLRPAT